MFFIGSGIRPTDGTVDKGSVYTSIYASNGFETKSTKIDTDYVLATFWLGAIYDLRWQDCFSTIAPTNCTATNDFGLSMTGKNTFGGGNKDPEDFNSAFGDMFTPAELELCWVPHFDNGGSLRCSFCRSVRGRNPDTTLLLAHQNWFYCANDMIDAYGTPLDSRLDNCEFGHGLPEWQCSRCYPGYATNPRYDENKDFTQSCIPNA